MLIYGYEPVNADHITLEANVLSHAVLPDPPDSCVEDV